jgi:hypothetical protein
MNAVPWKKAVMDGRNLGEDVEESLFLLLPSHPCSKQSLTSEHWTGSLETTPTFSRRFGGASVAESPEA